MFPSSLLANLRLPHWRAEPSHGIELSIAELDVRGADHSRLEEQRGADVAVDFGGRVVTHDEVVAMGLLDLVDDGGPGQRKDTPIVDAADDTAVLDDEATDGAGDPTSAVWLDGGSVEMLDWEEASVLLDFGKTARSNLTSELADDTRAYGSEGSYNCY